MVHSLKIISKLLRKIWWLVFFYHIAASHKWFSISILCVGGFFFKINVVILLQYVYILFQSANRAVFKLICKILKTILLLKKYNCLNFFFFFFTFLNNYFARTNKVIVFKKKKNQNKCKSKNLVIYSNMI